MASQLYINTKILKKDLVGQAQMLGYKNVQNKTKKELMDLLGYGGITNNHIFYQIHNGSSEGNIIGFLIFWAILIFSITKSFYLWWVTKINAT